MKYKNSAAILRANPFHVGHEHLISQMLKESENATILIGSAQESRTTQNPFTFSERRQMILNVFDDRPNLNIKPLDDIPHSNEAWALNVFHTLGQKPDAYYCSRDHFPAKVLRTWNINIVQISEKIGPWQDKKISASYIRNSMDMSYIHEVNRPMVLDILKELKERSLSSQPAVCFDIDGTITNFDNNSGDNGLPDWEKFGSPNQSMLALVRALSAAFKIIFITGRQISPEYVTQFMKQLLPGIDMQVFCKPKSFLGPTATYKMEQLIDLEKNGNKLYLYFDDRAEVVDMLKNQDYVIAQVHLNQATR